MDLLFQDSDASLGDTIRNRIKAKAAFWSFLNGMTEEILDTYSEELTPELIRTIIRLLYPYYNNSEILEEAKLLLGTLKMPVPCDYTELFAGCFEHVISGKVKAQHR